MNTTLQLVTLFSDQKLDGRIPPKAFGEVLRLIPEVVRGAIRMAFESRSQGRGRQPQWLKEAADIRLVGIDPWDDTRLFFEVPRLGEAASDLYRQQELWPTKPNPKDTGFDLLGDVIQDIADKNTDSDRYDPQLLNLFHKFHRGLNGTFQKLQFTSTRYSEGNAPAITESTLKIASKLFRETPEAKQIRVVGKLDMIRSSTNAFAIKLKSGEEARGVLVEGKIGRHADLMEREVLVLGKAIYRASGKLLRIDADSLDSAHGQAEIFSSIPKPHPSRFNLQSVLKEQQHKKGIAAVFGKWPGDESDEEIEQALKEMG